MSACSLAAAPQQLSWDLQLGAELVAGLCVSMPPDKVSIHPYLNDEYFKSDLSPVIVVNSFQ